VEKNLYGYTSHSIKELIKCTTSIWDLLSNSLPNLFMKVQGHPKRPFYRNFKSQIMRQVSSSGKLNENTINQTGKKTP
jgi:hypothetical protein